MTARNDPSVADDEQLNRRVLHRLNDFLVYDENLGRWTPGNAALSFDPDLSVYLGSIVKSLSLSPESILDSPRAAVVFAVSAAAARSREFGVEPSPVVPAEHPLDQAHGSVWPDPSWDKPEFRRRRNGIRREFVHVAGEILGL